MTLQLEEVSWGECANFEISPRLVVSHVPHIPTGKIYVPETRHRDARKGWEGWRLKVENEWETENDGGKLREGKSGFSCCNKTFLGLARLSKGKDVPPEPG